MLDTELWTTGLTTMVVGMGVVFSFLVILIFAIMIATRVIRVVDKLCPVAVEEVKTPKKISQDESEIALAIALAVQK